MDAVCSAPPHVWFVVHLFGILLAVFSRSQFGPRCTFCTSCLIAVSTAIVGVVATVGFLLQQPFWAASGCTLGLMAVFICFERGSHEPDRLLQAIAAGEERPSR